MFRGLSNKDIGRDLGTSEQVAKNYLRTAFLKLGLQSRYDLISRAWTLGGLALWLYDGEPYIEPFISEQPKYETAAEKHAAEVRARRKRMQLTDHFADSELGVAGCEDRLVLNARYLCEQLLEPLRAQFGPILVHDGYRDPGHNARVGGKPASFHLFEDGKAAADVSSATVANKTMFDWLRLESHLPFDKVILEYNAAGFAATVHLQIDSGTAPRRQAFTGSTGAGTVYTPQQVLP